MNTQPKKQLLILGAGGHGRVISDIAAAVGCYYSIKYLDDREVPGLPVVGRIADYVKYLDEADFVVAIGSNSVRERIQNEMTAAGASIATLIHPSVIIGSNVSVGEGTVVMPGAVLVSNACVGKGCIVNTCSTVDHDNVMEDFSHISAGVHLGGTAHIGRRTFVGIGATVSSNVTVCADCLIGAGAVVIHDVTEPGTYVGVPARKIHD